MRRREEDSSIGEDSFLDTTANLVGILIILVVIVGSKTQVDAAAHSRKLAEAESQVDLSEPVQSARATYEELHKLAIRQQEYELETAYRRAERDALLAKVQQARQVIDEKVAGLDDEKRASVSGSKEFEELQKKLAEITGEMGAEEETERPKIILEHLPTPMAKTVFTRELHVQLKAGKVTVIPWERLVDSLKEHVPLAARRQSSRNVLEETFGPIGGFMMRYRMLQVPGGFELERFELEPTPEVLQESLRDAFDTAGRLSLELAGRNASETVVTAWTYPDSFAEFREMKARLFEQGFLCAARPLPEGIRIGASPRGSRSTAQ